MSRLSLEERQAYLRQVIDIEINDEERSQMEDDGRNNDDENWLTGPDDCESDAEIVEAEIEISDCDDSDNDSHSDDESDSEAEQSNEYGQDEIPGEYFIGKDGTRWQKQAPPLQRIRQQNVFHDIRFKGPNPVTKNLSDVETFCTILCCSITSAICRHTNRKAESIFQNYNEKYPDKMKQLWQKLDEEELLANFGILLGMESQRSNYERLDSLWRKNSYPLYRTTMSANRFRNITRFIRFDQQNTRADRMASNKAAPISEIFEMINANLRRSYRPHENITVDEQLYPFRGRTKFTQNIPSKPAKYGIKLWWACDSKSSYPLTGQIYTGKVGNTRDIIQGERVVNGLVGYYKNTGRNITTDNFFTTIISRHGAKLEAVDGRNHEKNKTCLPPEFKASSCREVLSSNFGFGENKTICSYVPIKNKAVVLLSTMHFDDKVTEIKKKSEIILFYNATKGGVDTMDKMLAQYTTKRMTKRWPLALFFNFLDIAALASYIIYAENNPSHVTAKTGQRRDFIQVLAENLCRPVIRNMAQNPRTTAYFPTKIVIECMLGYSIESMRHPNTDEFVADEDDRDHSKIKGNCFICYHEANKRKRVTRKICVECRKPVCLEHSLTQTKCESCYKI